MIKHIALWRLKDDAGLSKEVMFAITKETVEGQVGHIPGLLRAEVGRNFASHAKAWDLSLVTEFEDMAALQTYHQHPRHLQTRAKVDGFVAMSAFVDFESA